jgi:hypothetical protein
MTIKLALLKSGENIISDIKELVNEDEKVVSLVFCNPYIVNLLTPQILYEESSIKEQEHKVSFYPWIPLSKDKEMAVDPSWVVTIVEPQEMVKSSYISKMNLGSDSLDLDQNKVSDIWSNVPLVDNGLEKNEEIENIWTKVIDDECELENSTLIENFEVITEEKDG